MATHVNISVAITEAIGVHIEKLPSDTAMGLGKGHGYIRPGETKGFVLDSATSLVVAGSGGKFSVTVPATAATAVPSTGARSAYSGNTAANGGIEGKRVPAFPAPSTVNYSLQAATVAASSSASVANQLAPSPAGPDGIEERKTWTESSNGTIAAGATTNFTTNPGRTVRYVFTGT